MLLEIKASLAQGAIFLVGLAVSLLVGMFLSAQLDGAPGLLFATIVAGSGLLGAAVLSQVAHDHIVTAEPDAPITTPAPPRTKR
jgi:hypothetical protein